MTQQQHVIPNGHDLFEDTVLSSTETLDDLETVMMAKVSGARDAQKKTKN